MNRTFDIINADRLIELIRAAQQRVVLVTPGMVLQVAKAIVRTSSRIGTDKCTVIVDPDTEVCRIWYGQIESLELLMSNGITIRRSNGLRIGVICVDDTALIYSPVPLSVEHERNKDASPNAVKVAVDDVERLIAATVPTRTLATAGSEIEVGKAEVRKDEVEAAKKDLLERPPVKPDLARQVRVISSEFQFVELKFAGGRIEQRVLPLTAKDLGVKNRRLSQKIKGQYKILEEQKFKDLEDINQKLENIRKRYLKPVVGFGNVIDYRRKEDFKKSVEIVKKEIEAFKENVLTDLRNKLEQSAKDVLPLVVRNFKHANKQDLYDMLFPDQPTEESLNNFVKRHLDQKFPSAEELLKGMECTYEFRMIAPEHLADPKFAVAIKAALGKPLAELAGENVVVETRVSE